MVVCNPALAGQNRINDNVDIEKSSISMCKTSISVYISGLTHRTILDIEESSISLGFNIAV